MLNNGSNVYIYNFSDNVFHGMTQAERGYWKDVGNVDSYWQANMDLLAYEPELNLYSPEWPLRTYNYNFPPAKFIWDEDERVGVAKNSLVSEGCIISGGMIPKVDCCIEALEKGVENVIIMDGRVPHSILMELLTDEGAGTMVTGGTK